MEQLRDGYELAWYCRKFHYAGYNCSCHDNSTTTILVGYIQSAINSSISNYEISGNGISIFSATAFFVFHAASAGTGIVWIYFFIVVHAKHAVSNFFIRNE